MKRFLIGALCASWVVLGGCAGDSNLRGTPQPERASDINLDLAIEALRKGNLAQAKEKLERSLDQNSRNARAHATAGLLYERLADPDKADTHYSRAVALDPENSEYKNNYATYLCRRSRFDRGVRLALQAAQNPLYKTPEVALLNAGNCARNGGNAKEAEAHYRKALEVRPRFSEALLQMAMLTFEQQNYISARAFFERYMEVGRTTPETLWLGLRIERSLGNSAMAQHYARRLKSEYPNASETKELIESERNAG